jgi:hypothetical protein
LAQVRQRCAGDSSDARDVNVEHAGPLRIVVLADVADRPDAGVVQQNIKTTQPLDDLGDRSVDRWSIRDLAAQGQYAIRYAVRTAVEDRDARTAPLADARSLHQSRSRHL